MKQIIEALERSYNIIENIGLSGSTDDIFDVLNAALTRAKQLAERMRVRDCNKQLPPFGKTIFLSIDGRMPFITEIKNGNPCYFLAYGECRDFNPKMYNYKWQYLSDWSEG